MLRKIADKYLKKTIWYQDSLFPDCKKFWNNSYKKLKVLNLGSTSAVYAFDYTCSTVNAANLAVRRNPLRGDLAILRQYSKSLCDNNTIVIITLCPFSSLAGDYDIRDERYYTILEKEYIPMYNTAIASKVLEMKQHPSRYYHLGEFCKGLKRAIVGLRHNENTEPKMIIDANNRMVNWLSEFHIESMDAEISVQNKKSIASAISTIDDLIAVCNESKSRPIVVIPPMYHTLSDMFSKRFLDQLLGGLECNLKIKGVDYYNCMFDKNISNNVDNFTNSFLLNKKGAQIFTNKILKQIGIYK